MDRGLSCYDDKIDEVFFEKKLKEYKDREFAILQEMEGHAKGDESFHVTANTALGLARRAREIFESSEVGEKRQVLNFVFQSLELKDKKLLIHYREPFKMIKDTSRLGKCPGMCPSLHLPRTNLLRACEKSMSLSHL
jgi:site-specific DNA recombinase